MVAFNTRLERAAEWLKNTNVDIDKVAQYLGIVGKEKNELADMAKKIRNKGPL